QISLLNDLIQSATRYPIRGVEVVIAKASADRYVGDFALLAHKLKDMENINVLFALAQMENRVYLVARSRLPEVNVGEIAAVFGGGGHPTAASATIRDRNLHELEEQLLAELEKQIRPIMRARDLMSFPVKTVEGQECIEQAGELLTRHNINVLPVIENEKIGGLISRQVVEKATFHGFKDSPVRDYMTSEFATVHPRTPLSRVQDLIVGNNQRFLPVMEKDRLVGAITRTDLLRWLYARGSQEAGSLVEPDFLSAKPRKRWILRLMEEVLAPEILDLLKVIGEKAEQLGFQAYAVGGFVRDLILRYANTDIDIVIEGDGIRLARVLAREKQGKIQVHKKFGTASLCFPAGYRVDIATARLEYYDYPAALPRVEHSSIKLDLYRRDFTVNTLALHLHPEHFGELIDFFGGQRDLKERMIRVLHNLSFVEDPTRIFRALRFEQRIGFQIAKHTQMLMENALRLGLLSKISGRRLWHELILCLAEDKPFPILRRMRDFNFLKVFHEKVSADHAMEVLFERLEEVVSWYRLLFTGEPFEHWMVAFLAMVDGLKEKELLELFNRLSPAEKFRSTFLERRRQVRQIIHRLDHLPPLSRSEIYFLLHPLPTEYLLYAMGASPSAEVKKAISLYFTALKSTKIALGGKDLRKLGYEPGPIYSEILTTLLMARLEGEVHSPKEEIEWVQRKFDQGKKVPRRVKKPRFSAAKSVGGV
ncbi:MAG: CBS domain-containing protein, partial [Deltaproteobacteria bacterium]|nr:CBS domain-containing protein [Deltaproteobacteria bacterium]